MYANAIVLLAVKLWCLSLMQQFQDADVDYGTCFCLNLLYFQYIFIWLMKHYFKLQPSKKEFLDVENKSHIW